MRRMALGVPHFKLAARTQMTCTQRWQNYRFEWIFHFSEQLLTRFEQHRLLYSYVTDSLAFIFRKIHPRDKINFFAPTKSRIKRARSDNNPTYQTRYSELKSYAANLIPRNTREINHRIWRTSLTQCRTSWHSSKLRAGYPARLWTKEWEAKELIAEAFDPRFPLPDWHGA